MSFDLAPLPFSEDELGEVMSAETLQFHHGQHHKTYVNGLNAILQRRPLPELSLAEVVQWAHRHGDKSLFNNGAQVWNHNFFWRCLRSPAGQRPVGRLAHLIDATFGSFERLILRMTIESVSHFSNGWVWLLNDRGTLRITSMHDADTPIVHRRMQPLLAIDVWEHAYYLDYRNARTTYATRVLSELIDWEFVAQNLDGKGKSRADQEQIAVRSRQLETA